MGNQPRRSHLFRALALFSLVSCGAYEGPYTSGRVIESEMELEEISSFAVLGQTTRDQVIAELGPPPWSGLISEDVRSGFYVWESIPFVLNEGDSQIGIFSPESMGVEPGKVSEAFILFTYDSFGIVSDKYVQGPEAQDGP